MVEFTSSYRPSICFIKMAKENGVENVYVHAFLDGRDVQPTSAIEFIKELEEIHE